MNRPIIKEGMKCYAHTPYSKMQLLCTIESINQNMVIVKMPCKLQGYTHAEISIKDIVLEQASTKPIAKPKPPAPKDNPYRRHLEYLLANPQPPKKPQKYKPLQTEKNVADKEPEMHSNNLLESYLLSLPIEQRRRDIEGLGDDGKIYHHLLNK